MIFQVVSNFNKILRKILVGSYRQEKISSQICNIILDFNYKKEIRVLDYGSGYFKPSLAKIISTNLKNKNISSKFVCLDFYNDKELKNLNVEDNIEYMNLDKFKMIKDKFDFCIVADTLHHIDQGVDNLEHLSTILQELKVKTEYLIIKDHYEHNFISRKLLQILDFFGNYQNKTNIPKRYFTKNLFNQLLEKSQLENIKIIENQKYYPWFFLFFNNSKFHFISISKKNDS